LRRKSLFPTPASPPATLPADYSAFNKAHQIISIYYFAEALEPVTAPLRSKPFDFDAAQLKMYAETGETETFRFIDWNEFSDQSVTLPIDKIVAKIIKGK
jgi:hypothetical protein